LYKYRVEHSLQAVGCEAVVIDHVGRSEANLGSSPVSSLGIVSDFIVSSVPDPVGQRSVFLHHVAHFYLSAE